MPCFYLSLLYHDRNDFLHAACQGNGKLCLPYLLACLDHAFIGYGKDLGIAGLVGFDAVTVYRIVGFINRLIVYTSTDHLSIKTGP